MNFRPWLAVVLVTAVLLLPASSVLASPPSNDAFAHASAISSLPFTGHANTASATLQSDEPTPSCQDQLAGSVWWRYTASKAQHLLAYLDAGQTIAIYQGTSLAGLSELGCDRYGGNVNFDLSAGQTIYIQVGTYAGNGGPETLHLQKQ